MKCFIILFLKCRLDSYLHPDTRHSILNEVLFLEKFIQDFEKYQKREIYWNLFHQHYSNLEAIKPSVKIINCSYMSLGKSLTSSKHQHPEVSHGLCACLIGLLWGWLKLMIHVKCPARWLAQKQSKHHIHSTITNITSSSFLPTKLFFFLPDIHWICECYMKKF